MDDSSISETMIDMKENVASTYGYNTHNVPPNNGLIIKESHYIPAELLSLILSYLDNSSIVDCMYVCKKWCDLINEDVWKIKAEREFHKRLLRIKPYRRFPYKVYMGICLKDGYERNLIKDGPETLNIKNWTITEDGGDKWTTESPPIGVSDIERNTDSVESPLSCYTTSYCISSKHQIIDLHKEGIHPNILDDYGPDIVISECYAARWDCNSVYMLRVELLDKDKNQIKEVDFQEKMNSWAAGWKKVNYRFKKYGPGVKFVKFCHKGCDSKYWAGHYGSKMGNASVVVDLQSINDHQLNWSHDTDN